MGGCFPQICVYKLGRYSPGCVWTELGPPSVRGDFPGDKLASKCPLIPETSFQTLGGMGPRRSFLLFQPQCRAFGECCPPGVAHFKGLLVPVKPLGRTISISLPFAQGTREGRR